MVRVLHQECSSLCPQLHQALKLKAGTMDTVESASVRDMLKGWLRASSRLDGLLPPVSPSIPQPSSLMDQSQTASTNEASNPVHTNAMEHPEKLCQAIAFEAGVAPEMVPSTSLSYAPRIPSHETTQSEVPVPIHQIYLPERCSSATDENSQPWLHQSRLSSMGKYSENASIAVVQDAIQCPSKVFLAKPDSDGIPIVVQTPPRLRQNTQYEVDDLTAVKRVLPGAKHQGVAYPCSLAGSPECLTISIPLPPHTSVLEAHAHQMPAMPHLLAPLSSSPPRKLHVEVVAMPPGKAVSQQAPPIFPGEHVRRARDRLRDLRQGLERAHSDPSLLPRLI
jgi:hypothetical protein